MQRSCGEDSGEWVHSKLGNVGRSQKANTWLSHQTRGRLSSDGSWRQEDCQFAYYLRHNL